MHPEENKNQKYPNFKGFNEHFTFAFKKTEKIVHALYIATSHITDHEPLKFELREKALSLLSNSLALNAEDSYDHSILMTSFFSSAQEALSLIDLASFSGHISRNNALLIRNEIESVVAYLRNDISLDPSRQGLILSSDFFATDTPVISKGHQKIHSINSSGSNNLQNQDKKINKEGSSLKDKKNSRKDSIVELLKNKPNLTIKDFAAVIKHCSEKTIQRELIELVEKGIVKREGERRWSTYSLK